ncbi:2-amino-4-hydroxy-6-hydroxymethyldihydropteridine diphosphokinase [Ekhidna sp. To15]|uniref:2-amino-4-hydroxy-6- hydroxymethyldihydropteridine diphosphokinase n=1 Tax=Ekhidna sp. To15 TaxID=3395267 RepID=UPI003F5258D3
MNGIYILLGSNMGNRLEYLREAERLLIKKEIQVIDESSIYETEPWGKKAQDWFLNVTLQINTAKEPSQLMEALLDVEQQLGRIRKEKWGERCIDIDLLYYHNQILDRESLTLPHPGIPDRRFTLILLAEMCPLETDPLSGKTQMQLLADCKDTLDCKLTDYKL